MSEHDLSFCKIIHHQSNLVELIPFEGTEVNIGMVDELNQYLLDCLEPPFSILVNKLYPYSLDFDAQRLIGVLPEIDATAIVAYTNGSAIASLQVMDVSEDQSKASKIFRSKEPALAWLKGRLESNA